MLRTCVEYVKTTQQHGSDLDGKVGSLRTAELESAIRQTEDENRRLIRWYDDLNMDIQSNGSSSFHSRSESASFYYLSIGLQGIPFVPD